MIVRAGTIVKLQQLIIILFSQCSTLVRNTVVRAIHSFNGKVGNSTLRGSVTPEPIEMKLCMVDYVSDPTSHATIGCRLKKGFWWAYR